MTYGLLVVLPPSRPDPCHPDRHVTHVTRRLVLAGAVAAVVTGCRVSDPTVSPTPGASTPPPAPASSAPPPLSGLHEGRDAELLVLAQADALARSDLDKAEQANLDWCLASHRRRVETLLADSPATRPLPEADPSASPFPGLPSVKKPKNEAAAHKALDATLTRAVQGHRERAVGLSGREALFWASLAAGAAQSQVVLDQDSAIEEPAAEAEHPPYEPRTEVAAAQALLAQIHAIVFGYQVALAPVSAQDGQDWVARLDRYRLVRDRLAELLRDRGVTAPAAEPEYETGDAADSPAAARALVARMEAALLPFTGAWVAACRSTDRATAVGWLVAGARTAVRSGSGPQLWPGWPD